jgi:hypothetical protein
VAERTMPEGLSDERTLLDGWLDYYRATLLVKCDGLTAQQLITRSCQPSSMSLIGLVRHMTEMERMYGHRLADWSTSYLYCTDENEDGDFEAAAAAQAAADIETFRAHCVRTRQIMVAHQLDETFGTRSSYTLRWFYLYLIKEYARHLGHADLLRELIDGVTGELRRPQMRPGRMTSAGSGKSHSRLCFRILPRTTCEWSVEAAERQG